MKSGGPVGSTAAAAEEAPPVTKQKKAEKKGAKDKKDKKDAGPKKDKKNKKDKKDKAQDTKKTASRKRQRKHVDAQNEENALDATLADTGAEDVEIAVSSREDLELELVAPDVGEDVPEGDGDGDALQILGESTTDPALVFPEEVETPAEMMPGQQASEQAVQGELEVMQELVQTLLVEAGGEAPLGALEQRIGEALGPEVLSSFILDRPVNKIYLPGKQICSLLESPSFNAAAAEESYWRFGQEFLAAGLDFDSEDRFKAMLSDLWKKRDEVREAARQGHITVSGNALELQPLGPMSDQERSLYNAALSAFTTLQERQSWVPLSQVLDDADVRRWRFAVPKGRRFWEWLDERFGQDLEMVTDGQEMLLHFAGYESRLQETAVARAEAVESGFASLVFDELTKRNRDSRSAQGMEINELCNLPAVVQLKFPQHSMRRALDRRPETFEVLRNARGMLIVTLQPGASVPRSSTQPAREASDQVTPQSLAEARALDLRKARFGDMPRKRSRLLTLCPPGSGGTAAQGNQGLAPGAQAAVERRSMQPSPSQGLPPLPSGWIRRRSRSTGSFYYVNQRTGKSQFELPSHPAVTRSDGVTPQEVYLD